MNGVEEDPVPFRAFDETFEGLGRFRTFGADGPLYEVLSVNSDSVRIHVFDNGEELDYRIERALKDPLAS